MSKFVDALEACVREAAARVAATSHVWHDHCVSPGEKTRVPIVMGAPELSLVPIGSAGHDGGGGGFPTAASPQPDIFVGEVLGDRSMSENGEL